MREHYSATSLETAACIWEAVLEARSSNQLIDRAFNTMGTSNLRLAALRWTELIDAAWEKARDSYDAPFDWEFVPAWIGNNIDWSGEQPIYRLENRA